MVISRWLVSLLCVISLPLQATCDTDTADYIVVGVGTAGGLMTGKLCADRKTSVIALNPGKNFTSSFILKYAQNMAFSVGQSFIGIPPTFNPAEFNLPLGLQTAFTQLIQLINTSVRKLYETGETTPQVNADDRVLSWVIAQPLGGASAVNAGAWVRITPQLMSEWEAVAGPNWSVGRLSCLYKALEDYTGKTANKQARGKHGCIPITQDPPASTLAKKFAEAIHRVTGAPLLEDYNNPSTPIGVSSQMQSAHTGHNGFYRVSSINAFLSSCVMHSNGTGANGTKLQVHFNSTALRVIWKGNTAVGVDYVENGVHKSAFARKGVIVCAGLGSSPFLLHSGIGPAALLTSLNIPVIFDNPNVGQGLIDQTPVPIVFLTNPNDSNAFSPTQTTLFSGVSNLLSPTGSPSGRQIRISPVDAIPGLTPVIVDLLQPKSRGTITIVSNNPLVQPVIDFGLLSDPSDLNLLVAAFQTYVKNLAIELQRIDPTYQLLFPPPEILDDTGLVTDFIQAIAGTDFHYQGHCRMAPLDQGGVVDSYGRVYGVNNLLIADNSIVPVAIDGSPMTSAYLIAANIAELLGY